MSSNRSRRHSLVALLLTFALVIAAGTSAVTLGAQDKSKKKVKATPEPAVATSPAPDASPTPSPEPTPYPFFDPSSVAIRADLVTDGLDAPVYLTDDGAPGDCVYVVEQGGRVRIVESDGYLRPSPFLDISKLVATGPGQGLQSIAFHPKFRKNGRFFVHYNRPDNAAVIAEFRGKPCAFAKPKQVKKLLTIPQEFPNNNAGWIGFGPKDGYLYVPLGDGGGRSPGDPNGYGQNKSTRLSKVLRIDVNKGRRYAIPRDNPYAKKKKGFPPEAWAMGLRDPRRASFDRKTGDLWIGDVGQDRQEEIDLIPAGVSTLNFGWSDVEGEASCHPNVPDCDPTLYEAPVWTYDKAPPHRAVTGGYVYRGKAIPELDGVYLFSDFASGYVWALDAEAVYEGYDVSADLLFDAAQGFVSFGQDDAGELYLVSFDGSIYKLNPEET